MDTVSGEFCVVIENGEEAGAVKTYFLWEGTVAKRMRVFANQFK